MLLILMILLISNIQVSSLINTVNIEIFSVNYKTFGLTGILSLFLDFYNRFK